MVFFTADTHFGHDNIIRFCDRPFQDVDSMNESLIANWNRRVTNADTVYVVGDMFFRCANAEEILLRLKGKKRLLVGNHDSGWMKKVPLEKYFVSVDHYLETTDGLHTMTLCHYPLLSWNHQRKSYMIHGHIHNDRSADFWPLLAVRSNVLNAGCDVNGYSPVSFDELLDNNDLYKRAAKESDPI